MSESRAFHDPDFEAWLEELASREPTDPEAYRMAIADGRRYEHALEAAERELHDRTLRVWGLVQRVEERFFGVGRHPERGGTKPPPDPGPGSVSEPPP